MSIRPIWEVPAAWQAADFILDFTRPSFGTLQGSRFDTSREISPAKPGNKQADSQAQATGSAEERIR